MEKCYILAVDQGTSTTKAIVFDTKGKIVSGASAEVKSLYPQPGFVEQDPHDIYRSALSAVRDCLDRFPHDRKSIRTCGISNQRETVILWDEHGRPLHNAVVWQCKRSVDVCREMNDAGLNPAVQSKTGLVIDPYFSGTKVVWLYRNDEHVKRAIEGGKARIGTVDSWLLYNLTGGRHFRTDYTNASRTLLFNIHTLSWDEELKRFFRLDGINLPDAHPSSFSFGRTDFEGLLPEPIEISAMIGDSHAAAFGEGVFHPGNVKVSMGTGASVLMNTGPEIVSSRNGMVSAICWSTRDRTDYALEGMIVSCGATIKWLIDHVGLSANVREMEAMAVAAGRNNGVCLIPAFGGLAAPYWKMESRGMITGMTFGCDKNHIARAALESIPFQVRDIVSAMEKDSGIPLGVLMADGGLTGNAFMMQYLANVLGTTVVNLGTEDVAAMGAAYMAGLEQGIFPDVESLSGLNEHALEYRPDENAEQARADHRQWLDAMRTFMGWPDASR